MATPHDDDSSRERPDRSLAEELVDQAHADGKKLVGPGGLLADLTKQVLETGLEVEMDEHLGYPKQGVVRIDVLAGGRCRVGVARRVIAWVRRACGDRQHQH